MPLSVVKETVVLLMRLLFEETLRPLTGAGGVKELQPNSVKEGRCILCAHSR